ncbi:uncharacterized protein LOC124366030 isoform X1 [Homalodisca vitripennis]|uniref:uncharacterized protein LOC124366030 isoform X1 n=1 Tax=Homalodisca vitripennis TaxID=197043 RepID=UPI001EEA5F74|nr:uncharacterized protein LOC124366030 isoform X1 [Homalodisca vitripennis]
MDVERSAFGLLFLFFLVTLPMLVLSQQKGCSCCNCQNYQHNTDNCNDYKDGFSCCNCQKCQPNTDNCNDHKNGCSSCNCQKCQPNTNNCNDLSRADLIDTMQTVDTLTTYLNIAKGMCTQEAQLNDGRK